MHVLIALVLASNARASEPRRSLDGLRAAPRETAGLRTLYDGARMAGAEPVPASEKPALKPRSNRDTYIFTAQAQPSEIKSPPPPGGPPTQPPQPSAGKPGPRGGFANGAKWGARTGLSVFKAGVAVATPFLVVPVVGWFVGVIIIAAAAVVGLAAGLVMALAGGLVGLFRK